MIYTKIGKEKQIEVCRDEMSINIRDNNKIKLGDYCNPSLGQINEEPDELIDYIDISSVDNESKRVIGYQTMRLLFLKKKLQIFLLLQQDFVCWIVKRMLIIDLFLITANQRHLLKAWFLRQQEQVILPLVTR
jgi:hypothetical protein